MSESVLDRITYVLEAAGTYDRNTTSAPIALLWPDGERQWESLVPQLRERMHIISFGAFDQEARRGRAYWLRCVIANTVAIDDAPSGTPVVYLPGVSRDSLRAIESVDAELAPLSALQHRCQWIGHPNGRDWTVRAMLANKERGLGLSVAADSETATALVDSLPELAGQNWNRLESKYIDAAFLNRLLNPDLVRSLLDWLDDPQETRASLTHGAWSAFVQQCKSEFGFDPSTESEIEAARRLGAGEGHWVHAWHRFRENPSEYPDIPNRLRQAQPNELLPSNPGSWPGLAEDEEEKLRGALERVAHETPENARSLLLDLEDQHKVRRGYVWADLGWTPLALALEHLAELARLTSMGSSGETVESIVEWYASAGWKADWAVQAALCEVERQADITAVESAIGAAYKPWADACARLLQAAVGPMANAATYVPASPPSTESGDVVVFVDGLRLDVAHRLNERLAGSGLETDLTTGLAALPTVTQTAKPALIPVDQQHLVAGAALDARRAPDGPAAGIRVLRGLLADAGVQVLVGADVGEPTGVAWTETGELDRRGHDLGLRLAHEVGAEVQRIATRIEDLLDAGWKRVIVITDHGWLLMPGGLPKNEDLPVAVTDTRKGRCARIKDGAEPLVPTVPWHWDADVRIAVAPGISCFEANQTYEHGGVSPQECVVPRLTVTRGAGETAGAVITSFKWRGLTLVVEFSGLPDGAKVDLRASAGDESSSIAETARVTGGAGKVILLVGDEDLEGRQAHLVLVGADGSLLLQRETAVGQNR
ncbi:BREX-1 system phosphatase PglZ type B [Candidatus Poriferisodalis sp.]|uniref:BREX-1 system phosphatase PglZ type B n=1 Tax=Candidatus Poriferisodalis sp. TaxID=3101277 RepID=UPI003B02B922